MEKSKWFFYGDEIGRNTPDGYEKLTPWYVNRLEAEKKEFDKELLNYIEFLKSRIMVDMNIVYWPSLMEVIDKFLEISERFGKKICKHENKKIIFHDYQERCVCFACLDCGATVYEGLE
jgi:hypothetical protein